MDTTTSQTIVERTLGYRVVLLKAQRDLSHYQLQRLDDEGNIVSSRPALLPEWQMFRMLCTPQSEWDSLGALARQER